MNVMNNRKWINRSIGLAVSRWISRGVNQLFSRHGSMNERRGASRRYSLNEPAASGGLPNICYGREIGMRKISSQKRPEGALLWKPRATPWDLVRRVTRSPNGAVLTQPKPKIGPPRWGYDCSCWMLTPGVAWGYRGAAPLGRRVEQNRFSFFSVNSNVLTVQVSASPLTTHFQKLSCSGISRAALAAIVAFALFCSLASAQSGELLRLVSEADFESVDEHDFQTAKNEAITALSATESHLRKHNPVGDWRIYLKLDELFRAIDQLKVPEPTRDDDLSLEEDALSFDDDLDDYESLDQGFTEEEAQADEALIEEAPEEDFDLEDWDSDDWELADGNSEDAAVEDADLVAIRQSLARTMGKHPGLETPSILALRSRLQHLLLTHARIRDHRIEKKFFETRDELMQLLSISPSSRDTEWYRKASPLLSWMDEFGQAEDATRFARSSWSKPNIHARISAPAMAQVTKRQVNETEPIREYDDGRWITGQAIASGVARMVPVDSPFAECRIVFDGDIHSTLGGSEGPVRFRLAGVTRLHVEQPVHLSANSFDLQPTLPSSSTVLWTDCVSTKRNGIGSRFDPQDC